MIETFPVAVLSGNVIPVCDARFLIIFIFMIFLMRILFYQAYILFVKSNLECINSCLAGKLLQHMAVEIFSRAIIKFIDDKSNFFSEIVRSS